MKLSKCKKTNVVLPVAGCLIIQLCVGIIYLWSIFKSSIVYSFSWSMQSANMVSSYMLIAFVTGCLLGGLLNDRRGVKLTVMLGIVVFSSGIALSALLTSKTIFLLNLTYAVMGGLGSGICYSACISCVQKWLPGHKGFASGIAAAAFGLSTVVFAPVGRLVMSCFTDSAGIVDFKLTFLVLASIFFVLGSVGCILVKQPETVKTAQKESDRAMNLPLRETLKTFRFWCLFLIVFFINGSWNLTVPLIFDLGISRGLSVAAATFAVSFTGVPNAMGRLIMASASDKIGRHRAIIISAALTAVAAGVIIKAHGVVYIAAISVIAFSSGGPAAVNAAICNDFFGSKHFATNHGALLFALGFSSLFFNAVSAKLLHGSIRPTFIMAAVTAVIALVLMCVLQAHWEGICNKSASSKNKRKEKSRHLV